MLDNMKEKAIEGRAERAKLRRAEMFYIGHLLRKALTTFQLNTHYKRVKFYHLRQAMHHYRLRLLAKSASSLR